MIAKTKLSLDKILFPVRDHYQTLKQPGIYALWCQEGNSRRLLSIRASDNLYNTILAYDTLQSLRVHSGNKITFSVYYMPQSTALQRETAAQALIRQAALEKE